MTQATSQARSPGQTPEQTVRQFIDAFRVSWPADFDLTLAPLAEDASYQIVCPTLAPIRGRAAIKAELLHMRSKVGDQKHLMKNVAASGNVVFTERVDSSQRNGKWVDIPLVAVFELNDRGEIAVWREFLDLAYVARSHGMTVDALCQSLNL
jgi:limonene-1,2-epoxide hydrolase